MLLAKCEIAVKDQSYLSLVVPCPPMNRFLLLFVLLTGFYSVAVAQVEINGELHDFANGKALDNVNVRNIHTMQGMTTDSDGTFRITVRKGELVECSKLGYQTLRVRIQSEKEPLYYKLVLKKVPIELREVDIRGKPLDFKTDSVRYRAVYDVVLRKENRSEVNMQSMPLAMLSKKNRQEWAFQDMYARWEEEKFIDMTFNARLVERITYLQGEKLDEFMRIFRPSAGFLRNATEYEYLDYIRRCYEIYTHRPARPER